MKKNTASTLKKTGNRKGFSLVELLVAMSLSGIIVSAVYGLFIHQNKSLIVQGQVTENQQNIRSAMEIMGMDLKMAGFGFSIAGTASYYNGTGISTLKAVAATNNSTSPDSIQISYGDWSVKAKLTSPMTTHSSPLLVNSTSGFLANDIIIITDGTNASLLQITGINSGELVHGSSPLNPPFGFSFFPRAYAVGSSVYKLKQVCYRINNSNPNHPCLEVDLTGPFLGASFQTLAANMEDLQIAYRDDINVWHYTASNGTPPNSIRDIRVNLVGRTRAVDPEFLGVRPGLEDRPAGLNDHYRRRALTSTFMVRNLGM